MGAESLILLSLTGFYPHIHFVSKHFRCLLDSGALSVIVLVGFFGAKVKYPFEERGLFCFTFPEGNVQPVHGGRWLAVYHPLRK